MRLGILTQACQSESWDQNPGEGGKSAWLILWRKQKAELEKITSIREEHWDILGHLRTRRLGTDIYKPLVIDQVIVLRRDYKGSVGAGLSLCRTGDNARLTMVTPALRGPTLRHWRPGH